MAGVMSESGFGDGADLAMRRADGRFVSRRGTSLLWIRLADPHWIRLADPRPIRFADPMRIS